MAELQPPPFRLPRFDLPPEHQPTGGDDERLRQIMDPLAEARARAAQVTASSANAPISGTGSVANTRYFLDPAILPHVVGRDANGRVAVDWAAVSELQRGERPEPAGNARSDGTIVEVDGWSVDLKLRTGRKPTFGSLSRARRSANRRLAAPPNVGSDSFVA
jgi:hypothetical protein